MACKQATCSDWNVWASDANGWPTHPQQHHPKMSVSKRYAKDRLRREQERRMVFPWWWSVCCLSAVSQRALPCETDLNRGGAVALIMMMVTSRSTRLYMWGLAAFCAAWLASHSNIICETVCGLDCLFLCRYACCIQQSTDSHYISSTTLNRHSHMNKNH